MAKNKSLKDLVAQGSTGAVRRVKEGETAEVRFLFEPSDQSDDGRDLWVVLGSYWDEELKRSIYVELDDDYKSDASVKVRKNYFTVAYDTESQTVNVWELRYKLMQSLSNYEEEYDTITDRNYKLKRKGKGIADTDYIATPLAPKPMNKKMEKAKRECQGMLDAVIEQLVG